MKIGVIFPQTELGGDVGAVRGYGETLPALGFTHLLAYDHVLGADPAVHNGWDGPYDVDSTFHEPFVLFGFLAAITSIELVTGVIIAPQRQTALLAKQATEVDLLTGGKVRLGLGVGWNVVEYEALGQPFDQLCRRLTEQITLLRALWTQRSVTFDGTFDRVSGAGLAPPPVQCPIPIWIGGSSDPAYRRIGRLADGWFPMVRPGPDLRHARDVIAQAATEVSRDPTTIGMEGRVLWDPQDPDRFVRQVEHWRAAGATHLTINTMGLGLDSAAAHLAALEHAARLCDIHPQRISGQGRTQRGPG